MKKRPLAYFLFGWLPAALCAVVIYYLSSRPAHALPSLWFDHMDKIIHAGEFGALALLLFRAVFWPVYRGIPRQNLLRAALFILLFCAIYALLDEIHQIFVPGRSATFPDWTADMAGAILALGLCLYVSFPKKKKSPPY